MPENSLTVPLDEADRLAADEQARRIHLLRAQSEAARHESSETELRQGAPVPWSPTVVVLGLLGILTMPLVFALYAWAFNWWLEPGMALVASGLFTMTGLVVGIARLPSIRGISVAPWARMLFAVVAFLLPASAPATGALWLSVVGLMAAACLLMLPRYAIALVAHRRADRHRRRSDEAWERAAYLDQQGGSSGSSRNSRSGHGPRPTQGQGTRNLSEEGGADYGS